ncbi:MAG: hypothetical protein QXD48_00040 [Candidatus Aenigmatarchaeota archaeon]
MSKIKQEKIFNLNPILAKIVDNSKKYGLEDKETAAKYITIVFRTNVKHGITIKDVLENVKSSEEFIKKYPPKEYIYH